MASSPGFVSYSVSNDKAFAAKLKEARQVTDDLRIPLRKIAIDFYKGQKAIFGLKSKGRYPDFKGKKIKDTWKRPGLPQLRTREGGLTPYAFSKKKKYGFLYPLLVATGKLGLSASTPDSEGSIYTLGKTTLQIGTSIEYGKYHQQDSRRGQKMPLRKFLFIGPESDKFSTLPVVRGRLDRFTKELNTFIAGKLGKTFKQRVEGR
jgi:phage gpG-like protein